MSTLQGIIGMIANERPVRISYKALVIAAVLTLASVQAQAAPGSLSQVPLFLAQGVQPNIFFLLDNSTSMDWEVLSRNDGDGDGNVDFTPDSTTEQLELCFGYNVLAYDPETLTDEDKEAYTPWYGLDMDGNEFEDADPSAAMVNPYTGDGNSGTSSTTTAGRGGGPNHMDNSDKNDSSSGECASNGVVSNTDGTTCDLIDGFDDGKGGRYYEWTDSDGDGQYDEGECSTTPTYVSDLTTAQQTNYANWFSYYRKREYVMKRALSQIITESRDRVGLGVLNTTSSNQHLNDSSQYGGTPVKDIDDVTLPVDSEAASNKETLLDNLLGVDSGNFTPLRRNLEAVGEYFSNSMSGTELFGYTPDDDEDSAAGYSPILDEELGGTCQQNFVVLLSDGFWDGSDPSVANADGDASTIFDGQSYADTGRNTLADVAMSLYEGDLLTGLANEVPIVSIPVGSDSDIECYDDDGDETQECFDTNNAQHLVTFTVSFGLSGTIPETDEDGEECIPGNRTESLATQKWPSSCGASFNGWPTPVEHQETTVDDMRHAAWNGRGRYLSASLPDELISQLEQAVGEISARNPVSASAVTVDSFNMISGGTIYQGRFDAGIWAGELYAMEYEDSTIGDDLWAAHKELAGMDTSDRILVTYNGTQGIPFAFPDDYTSLSEDTLSQEQVNDLLYNAPYNLDTSDNSEKAANQEFGESLVDYLRGDVSNEGTGTSNFRKRYEQRLGDIIHSGPVFVGDPDAAAYPDTIADDSYQAWAYNSVDADENPGAYGRQEMIYVGANDGALHAFNADTGAEVFAYYPQAIFSDEESLGLHWLADPNYEHRYYVDGEPVVAEVYVDTDDGRGLAWHTLLVGGLRGGGRAIYAIDVTYPSEFSDASGVAENILWEFTHPDLGYTYGKPTIAKMNDGRWAAIFGNGYNPSDDSADGAAKLFIKYLDTDSPSYRVLTTLGSDDDALIANGDCSDADSDCNGLSTPAVVDLGGDVVADRAYAGDVQGNLWVFDLSSDDPDTSSWGVAYGTTAAPEPLMTANYREDGEVKGQPITAQPIVTLHPTESSYSTQPNTMVFFGTGQYLTENDPTTDGTNSFYGVWDSGEAITFNRSATTPVLVEQTITEDYLDSEEVRLLSSNTVDYGDTYKGWYVDLPDSGERVIVTPIVYDSLVVYTTLVPESNLCSDSAGYSWLMVHNLADGSAPSYVALDITGDGVFDSSDQVDGAYVAGVKSSELYWQPSIVKSEVGPVATLLISTDNDEGLTQTYVQGTLIDSARTSWGNYRYDD